MENKNIQKFIQSVLKGIGIAASGGGIAIGAGSVNLVNVDFLTIVYMVICCSLFNLVYQYFRRLK